MSAISHFKGPKAQEVLQRFLKALQDRGEYDTYTVTVDGNVEVWQVTESSIEPDSLSETSVELGNGERLDKDPKGLLAAITSGHKDVFATYSSSGQTLGSINGKVF